MTISIGDTAPPLEQTITLADIIAYAGATWDWHRMHYDPAYLQSRKLPAPVVDGQLFGALLVRQVQDWLGATATLQRLHFRFKNLVFAGETVVCSTVVLALEPQAEANVLTLGCAVAVLGANARVAVAPAGAQVVVRR